MHSFYISRVHTYASSLYIYKFILTLHITYAIVSPFFQGLIQVSNSSSHLFLSALVICIFSLPLYHHLPWKTHHNVSFRLLLLVVPTHHLYGWHTIPLSSVAIFKRLIFHFWFKNYILTCRQNRSLFFPTSINTFIYKTKKHSFISHTHTHTHTYILSVDNHWHT